MKWNLVGSIYGYYSIDVSEKRILRNRPTRNKNCLWHVCLLTDQDEISNLYRALSIYVSYQVSVHLAKQFQPLLWNCLAKWTEIWWEASMEGSVLSFLKAEWKVSDTGSGHGASSFVYFPLQAFIVLNTTLCNKICQWLVAGRWFSPVLWFPPPITLTAMI
jgi:hypothetical protein